MYELIQVAPRTFYMDCPSKVGFYKVSEDEVVLIDAGSDKDAAKKVKKILDAQGWRPLAIYNTHSHADHIGGNAYLQAQTGCKIFAPAAECGFVEHPMLEPDLLYGGRSTAGLHDKFLFAKESHAEPLCAGAMPEGLEFFPLPSHTYDMVGYRTADSVIFLADCLASDETMQKHKIGYLYDVKAYLETLENVKTMQATCFVPSHAPAAADIAPLAERNIAVTKEVADKIAETLAEPKSFDDLLGELFDAFDLKMTFMQHYLVGSTVRSYLSYLLDEGRIGYTIENNRMKWHSVN